MMKTIKNQEHDIGLHVSNLKARDTIVAQLQDKDQILEHQQNLFRESFKQQKEDNITMNQRVKVLEKLVSKSEKAIRQQKIHNTLMEERVEMLEKQLSDAKETMEPQKKHSDSMEERVERVETSTQTQDETQAEENRKGNETQEKNKTPEKNKKNHWPDEMKELVEDVYDKIVSAHDHEEMIVKKTLLEETAGKKHLVTNPTMTTSVRKRNAHCVIRYLSIFVGEHLA